MKIRIFSYLGIWLSALIATDPTFGLWSVAWMFPLGLYAFFFPSHRNDEGWTVMIVTIALYLVHAVFYFRAKTMRSELLLGGVLVVLLICNAAGCRMMIHHP